MPTPKEGYTLLDGTRVPGTTTIISRFKESGALMYWAWQQGKEGKDFRETKQKAGDAGTLAHDMVELHIHGKDINLATEGLAIPQEIIFQALSAYDAYLSWERQTKMRIIATELQLVHEGLRFGGTPDAIGMIEGEHVLPDWKSSNGIYADYLIQLAAYKLLIEEGHYLGEVKCPPPMEIKGFHLLRFSKENGDFHHHYFKDLSEAEEMFRLLRRAYDIDQKLKKRVR